jgi:hypothetical protein
VHDEVKEVTVGNFKDLPGTEDRQTWKLDRHEEIHRQKIGLKTAL